MALMFQRLARNYAKNGYFPTDADTIERVLATLEPPVQGDIRILDPCAGEGAALAECKHYLGQERTLAYAVEFNAERAGQTKRLVDRCIQGDFQETLISPRSFGLLWLNPPYGDLVSDQAQTGTETAAKSRKRLEKLFYQQSVRLLQYGGILVLIVPHYSLDAEFRRWLASGFDKLSIHLAPEQQFNQAVIMGVRKPNDSVSPRYKQQLQQLEAFCLADEKPVLPATGLEALYPVPASADELKFHYSRLEPEQLAEEITRFPCLWGQFNLHFGHTCFQQRRPLMPLSQWHLALVLAAGHVAGIVQSNDGKRTYVVKGDTFKHKKTSVQIEEIGDHDSRTVTTQLDVFIPVIKALDFTPDSPTFGRVLTIQ